MCIIKLIFKSLSLLTLLLCLFTTTGCRDHEDLKPNYTLTPEQKLQTTFYEKWGEPASSHTWNTAVKRTLDITLPQDSNLYKVSVFTANPSTSAAGARRLACFDNISAGQHTFSFDAPGYTDTIAVVIKDNGKSTVLDSIAVNNGTFIAVLDKVPTESLTLYYYEMQYLMLFEDLNIALDLDYNDVVFGITHVSGLDYINVSLYAIGSLLYDYAFFDETALYEGRELHDYIGSSTTSTVNTFSTGKRFTLENRKNSRITLDVYPELRETITVPTDFSIVDSANKLYIKTCKTSISTNTASDDIKTITVPTTQGAFPYAMLIADPDFEWPSEGTTIGDAYSGFEDWVKNPTLYNWHMLTEE